MAQLPKALRPHVQALSDALAAVARGEEPGDDPGELFDQAMTAATGLGGFDPYSLSVTIPDVVSGNLRRLRKEAGLSQQALADTMTALGFDWKRTTVPDVERETYPGDERRPPLPPRRLTYPEMVAIATLYGVPVLELFTVPAGETVDLEVAGLSTLTGDQLRELFVGRGGVVGTGGPTWSAAAAVVAGNVERPARQLWKTRRTEGGK
jgi:transcriptional regulator with XRE-family HTH domain